MVNVSTLVYVLENLEGKKEEIINLNEVHDLERKYLDGLFARLDRIEMEMNQAIMDKILQAASTQSG
jgi:hypothetical protein